MIDRDGRNKRELGTTNGYKEIENRQEIESDRGKQIGDRLRQKSIYEGQAEIKKRVLKEICVNLDKHGIVRYNDEQTRDRDRYRKSQINKGQTEMKRRGSKRDRRRSGLTKRQKEIEVYRQEIETDTDGYITDRLR